MHDTPAHALCPARRHDAARPAPPVAPGEVPVPEEVPVALTYGRATHAVMMATPRDLEDFGLGFSLTEGIIAEPRQLTALEVLPRPAGFEVRMTLSEDRDEALLHRRRYMAGPVGCGLCGLESLEAVLRPLPRLEAGLRLAADAVPRALAALSEHQPLHDVTHAVHAAGFWRAGHGLVLAREDVGRHNALDKLVGAVRRQGEAPAGGAVVLTSRVSVEMVQKTVLLGAPVLIAVSAPTALAVRTAGAAGLTLIARARGGRFDVFTHPERLLG